MPLNTRSLLPSSFLRLLGLPALLAYGTLFFLSPKGTLAATPSPKGAASKTTPSPSLANHGYWEKTSIRGHDPQKTLHSILQESDFQQKPLHSRASPFVSFFAHAIHGIRTFLRYLFQPSPSQKKSTDTTDEPRISPPSSSFWFSFFSSRLWWYLALALAVLCLFFLLRRVPWKRPSPQVSSPPLSPLPEGQEALQTPEGILSDILSSSPQTLWGEALRLAEQGLYRQAVRSLFRFSLLSLHHSDLLPYRPHMTNGEILRSLPSHAPFLLPLTSFNHHFERFWYGLLPASSRDFEICKELAQEIARASNSTPSEDNERAP